MAELIWGHVTEGDEQTWWCWRCWSYRRTDAGCCVVCGDLVAVNEEVDDA